MSRIRTRPVNHKKADLIEVPVLKKTTEALRRRHKEFQESVGNTLTDFTDYVSILLQQVIEQDSE